jgi:hypothetical protein
MNQETLGIIRHLLTTVGGGLVTKGIISGSDLQDVAGAVAILIGVVWSVLHKQDVKKQLEVDNAPFPENH